LSSEKYTCLVNVIDTIDKKNKMQMPYVTLEKVQHDAVKMFGI